MTLLVQIHAIFAKSYLFYKLPMRMNLHELPSPNTTPKLTHHWGLKKAYVWGRMNSYELPTS